MEVKIMDGNLERIVTLRDGSPAERLYHEIINSPDSSDLLRFLFARKSKLTKVQKAYRAATLCSIFGSEGEDPEKQLVEANKELLKSKLIRVYGDHYIVTEGSIFFLKPQLEIPAQIKNKKDKIIWKYLLQYLAKYSSVDFNVGTVVDFICENAHSEELETLRKGKNGKLTSITITAANVIGRLRKQNLIRRIRRGIYTISESVRPLTPVQGRFDELIADNETLTDLDESEAASDNSAPEPLSKILKIDKSEAVPIAIKDDSFTVRINNRNVELTISVVAK